MTNLDLFEPVVSEDDKRDYLAELVGDDKRFKTPQDLAKSKFHGDDHIKKLETELASLRQDLSTRLTLEELADRISSIQDENDSLNNRNTNGEFNNEASNQSSSLTPEQVDNMFNSKLAEYDKTKLKEANSAYVLKELQNLYGGKYAERIKAESDRLGLGKEFVNNLAAEQPQAFLKIFGTNPSFGNNDVANPPKGNITIGQGPLHRERTESYYNELRDKDPTSYWSPKVQNQLHKDAIDLGERFFDISGV